MLARPTWCVSSWPYFSATRMLSSMTSRLSLRRPADMSSAPRLPRTPSLASSGNRLSAFLQDGCAAQGLGSGTRLCTFPSSS